MNEDEKAMQERVERYPFYEPVCKDCEYRHYKIGGYDTICVGLYLTKDPIEHCGKLLRFYGREFDISCKSATP